MVRTGIATRVTQQRESMNGFPGDQANDRCAKNSPGRALSAGAELIYSPAASLSASRSACVWLMRPAGTDGSAARSFLNAATLSLPLTSHIIVRARLIT